MGKVKTEQVKRVAKELIQRFPEKFSGSFEENKPIVDMLTKGTTTKVRNQIAGYISRVFSGTTTEAASKSVDEETQP